MDKIIYTFLLSFFFVGCNFINSKSVDQVSQKNNDLLDQSDELFYIPALNDSLYYFMEVIGNIKNPYNSPKFNNVIFTEGSYPFQLEDTVIIFLAQLTPYNVFGLQKNMVFKGGCRINGEFVAVYYNFLTDLKHIVNESLLNVEYIENAKLNIPKDTLKNEWNYIGQEWIYVLSENNLKIKRKQDFIYSSMDDIGEEHGLMKIYN